jgi:hypothetical protein
MVNEVNSHTGCGGQIDGERSDLTQSPFFGNVKCERNQDPSRTTTPAGVLGL